MSLKYRSGRNQKSERKYSKSPNERFLGRSYSGCEKRLLKFKTQQIVQFRMNSKSMYGLMLHQ